MNICATHPDYNGEGPPSWSCRACRKIRKEIQQCKKAYNLKNALQEIAELREIAKKSLPSRTGGSCMTSSGSHMLEINIPDLHLGKLAWSQETGHPDYDSKIAEEVFEDALSALIERTISYKFEQILLPLGNDLLHSDTKFGTTTAGTVLDTDSRYQKNFSRARNLAIRAIDRLRCVAPVRVIMVAGNHDTLSVWHLGDSLECFYHAQPDVTIDNSPCLRKYHRFGNVMLMLTHGHNGKLADYPILMATEAPFLFGASKYREAHTGHTHQLKVQEIHGVRVRTLSALCPPDAWHADRGFVGNLRSAEAFVWHKEEGLIGTAIYTL